MENSIDSKTEMPKKSNQSKVSSNTLITMIRRVIRRSSWRKPLSLIEQEMKEEEIERTLGFFDLLMIGIGGTVGSGVFATAGLIASTYAGPAAIFSWIIAGVGCVFSGTSFMELSAIVPSAGSSYAYSYHAMGELPAMIAGFLLTLEYGVSSAGGARSWSSKFQALLRDFGIEGPSWMIYGHLDIYAGLLQLLCVSIILMGISAGKQFINVITTTKIIVVLFIIVVGLTHYRGSNLDTFLPPPERNEYGEIVFGWPGVMLGASASFYGYIGYDEVCCLAGEAKDPKRNIPRAVFGTVIGAAFLSVMATFSLVGMQFYKDIDHEASYGKAFESNGLNWAKRFVETGEVITMPVGVLIGFLAQPRLQYAMAKDGLLPSIFARVREDGNIFWGTFISGILLTITSLIVEFTILWDFISLGILLAFNMTNASVILVRFRRKSPTLAPSLCYLYCVTSLIAAFIWQKGIIASPLVLSDISIWYFIAGILFLGISIALMILIWLKCPQERVSHNGFQAPFVPFTPCIAIVFNWFLFAQMHWGVIGLIALWVIFAIIVYLIYGLANSTSKKHAKDDYKRLEMQELSVEDTEDHESDEMILKEIISEICQEKDGSNNLETAKNSNRLNKLQSYSTKNCLEEEFMNEEFDLTERRSLNQYDEEDEMELRHSI